jgi:AcrR family transcriptional regulator
MTNTEKFEVSPETIVIAAIAILNRDGLPKLTIRALADELGIKSASLYWHIHNKQELYDLIAEKICSGIKPVSGLGNAKQYLIEVSRLYRQKLLEVRDSVEIFTHSAPSTPYRLELIKNTLISLLHLGIKEKNCIVAANMFNNYILSFVADEVIWHDASEDTRSFDSVLGTGYEKMSADEQFICGLDVLFAGFKILK